MGSLVGCDESLIRYLVIIGELPYPSKVRVWAGESPRESPQYAPSGALTPSMLYRRATRKKSRS